jgi:hypothetical protein
VIQLKSELLRFQPIHPPHLDVPLPAWEGWFLRSKFNAANLDNYLKPMSFYLDSVICADSSMGGIGFWGGHRQHFLVLHPLSLEPFQSLPIIICNVHRRFFHREGCAPPPTGHSLLVVDSEFEVDEQEAR